MRDRIVDLLEKVDLALAASAGVIPDDQLVAIGAVRDLIRTRLAYPEDVVVAGLVGGTGSGKSSLLNAVAGAEVAETAGMRPTTSAPLALVPARRAGAMAGYLAMMEVETASDPSPIEWLCLIDLPDTDSIVTEHRLNVDQLLPNLDLVVWVLDPEKYRDRSIHALIAGLSEHSGQFVFALNQMDRVPPGEAEAIRSDLLDALADYGVSGPAVALVAAAPPSGPPIGIDSLIELVQAVAGDERAVYSRLLADLDSASSALVAALSGGGGGLNFEARWSETTESMRISLASGRPSEAAHALTGLLDSLAGEAGGPVGDEIASLIGEVPGAVEVTPDVADTPRRRRRGSRKQDESTVEPDLVLGRVEERIGHPVRQALARRAVTVSAISDLHLSVVAARGPDRDVGSV